ncbi:hypothetical protein [Streptomyces sp. NPDC057199]|uniref:hypothetical protein n=1 Tax=Streptomyces sp. NPDC057199 TaxID=3346047 RepID=UPI00363B81E1
MNTPEQHGFVFRAPWYACERDGYDRFDPRATPPALQKYDAPEFVRRLVEDPRDSLRFDDREDVWSFPVPVGLKDRGPGRARFATHTLVRTRTRKLYQPGHERFYAVVAELFCDRPGLPRPQDSQGLEVGMVMRRRRAELSAPPRVLRTLTRRLTSELRSAQRESRRVGDVPMSETRDVLWADLAHRLQFEQTNEDLVRQVGLKKETQAWVAEGTTGGRWHTLGRSDDPPQAGEEELPMWQLPTLSGDCADDRLPRRSLWFGVVPTSSAAHDGTGAPKLDDNAVYELRCFVRRAPRPGLKDCPPRIWLGEPTAPFKLASFYDPEGTKNRRVSVTLPDLRTLAARAGGPPGAGGVAVTTPPGSQLNFHPGAGTPKDPELPPGGTIPRTCTFALELFMIVAFFVFSLFMPIVVFLFQLWWLLALRFCLPPAEASVKALEHFFDGSKKWKDLTADQAKAVDALLGKGAAAGLQKNDSAFTAEDMIAFKDVAVPPASTPAPVHPKPLPPVDDPLCGGK